MNDENIEAVDEENVIIPEEEYERRNTNARHWISAYIIQFYDKIDVNDVESRADYYKIYS